MCAMVWGLSGGAADCAAAPDDTMTTPDSLQMSDNDSAVADDSVTMATAIADTPSPDEEYIFTEEQPDTDTAHTSVTEPMDSLPLPRKTTFSPDRGERFLSRVTMLRLLAEKTARLLSEPVILLQKHAVKLVVLIASLLIILFTISFYRERRERGRFLTTTRLSVMDKEVQRSCRYIEEHFDDPDLGIDHICAALVTGGAFLEALFVKELGLTVEDFIAQVRINRAKIILRSDTGILTATLAGQCGFSDENRFLERFSTITGCSLDEYRRNLSGQTDVPV